MPPPKDPVKLAEWKRKQSESHKGQNLGGTVKPRSEEWYRKQRESHLGQHCSDETRAKMSATRKGVPKSEEHKKKISESKMGHVVSEEARTKISNARKESYTGENHPRFGAVVTEESRIKMRESNIKTWAEHPEIRGKVSNANSGKNNGSYIDGRNDNYPLYVTIRGCTKMREWRRNVYRRDSYTCQLSGVKGRALEPHHLKSLADICRENGITTFEEAMKCDALWDVSNGITLEKTLHRYLHSKHGKQIPLEEFKNLL